MKAIIQKLKKRTKYTLPNFYIKTDSKSDLIIINLKLIKRLRLKVKFTNTFMNYYLNISIANGNFLKLKNWVKFWIKVSIIQ